MNFKRITSLQHPLVKHVIKLRENGDYRHEHSSVVIEGFKTISELSSQINFTVCIIEEGKTFSSIPNAKEYFAVSTEVMKKISGVVSPEGMIVESPLPSFKNFSSSKRVLALDGVSDPGNFGTLLRTAIAFGWDGVWLLPSCVDPFNDKVIRSSKGAPFLIDLMHGDNGALKRFASENGFKVFYADTSGHAPESISIDEKIVLVLGNESQGINFHIKSFGNSVSIPMVSMESLNVAIAGSILMYLWKGF